MATPKFTKREQAKIQVVFDALRAKLAANLSDHGYNNDIGCGNCGDTSSFHSTLSELATMFGLKQS